MPENAKVFLVEKDEGISKMAVAALKASGHQVVLSASNFEEAKTKIELATEKKVRVAVIDGNIGGAKTDHAQEIAELLKMANPEIKTVAFTWYQRPKWGEGFVDKGSNPGGLGKAVTEL